MKKENISTKKVGVWQVGKNYVIRSVTMINIGRLIEVTEEELVLEEACWIADTGRWMNFLRDGKYSEAEPFQDKVSAALPTIIDATMWRHKLPKDQK